MRIRILKIFLAEKMVFNGVEGNCYLKNVTRICQDLSAISDQLGMKHRDQRIFLTGLVVVSAEH